MGGRIRKRIISFVLSLFLLLFRLYRLMVVLLQAQVSVWAYWGLCSFLQLRF